MPKEKGKDKGPEYTLITLDENHLLQLKNDSLIQRVRNSGTFIEDAELAVQEIDAKTCEYNEWLAYLACDPIPKAFQPESMRRFLYKSFFYENEDTALTMNWQLAVDERSILSQDIDMVDMTNRFLKRTKVDFGKQYDTRVAETMMILFRIIHFLDKPTVELSERILNDIEQLKFVAYREINNYIDNLTYRILCSEEAYMDSIEVTTAEYSYAAQNFDIHIWTFKNVPIYLDPQDTPMKIVKLSRINTTLVVPFSVLCENMVIRGLHCHFDHFSAHARFFELPKTEQIDITLKTVLKNEWTLQKKIQSDVKAFLIKQRADFDEAMRLKAEEEELKAKLRKKEEGAKAPKPEKNAKPKKAGKEPLIVPPGFVPLIRRDFLNQDLASCQEEMLKFHPESFKLTPGEVNLRKFQILGGVYQLNCLSKPTVTKFPQVIMTWYTAHERIQQRMTDSIFGKDKPEDISKFFEITFELAEQFCYWGEPIPCLFEAGKSFNLSSAEHDNVQDKLNVSTPIIVNDFNLHDLFNKRTMYHFVNNTIPRIISSFKFPEDINDDEDDKKGKATLGRAKLTAAEMEREKELAMQKLEMSFVAQQSPERLFPLFKKVIPVVILPLDEEFLKQRIHPYEHFSEFLTALENIKENYRASTFKNKKGKIIKVSAEQYSRNIRRPRVSKFVAYDTHEEKDDERSSAVHATASKASLKGGSAHSITGDTNEGLKKAGSRIDLTESGKHDGKPKKGKHKRLSKTKLKEEEVVEEEEEMMQPWFSKWSTSNILKSEFNASKRTVTIWTDRLGTFAFAFYRYQHFPYQSWSVQPNEDNPEEVELIIESMYAVFRIYVSSEGYRISVSDFAKYYKNRKIYFEITNPEPNLEILKWKLQQCYLNIFPERDASWYITGYFCEKHQAAEFHTYNCLSLYALSLKFMCSFWNKLSNRRIMVLKFGELRDLEEDMFLLRITPEDVTFVEIKEVCTDLEVIELEYSPTWRNFEWYPDLNHLITSNFNNASDMRINNPKTICYLKNILQAIRPLSCS